MWLKLDVGFFSHPKALAAGRDGRDLYLAGLCWSAGQETDGLVPAHALALVAMLAGVPDPDQTASRLVEVGLWAHDPDGWVIHSYGDWQTTKAERDLWKSKERARKQRARTITKGDQTIDVVREVSARTTRGIRALDVDVEVDNSHQSETGYPQDDPQPVDDDDERATEALRHLAGHLAQRHASSNPAGYARTVVRQAEQLPTLIALARRHPNDTAAQLAQRHLADPTPPPPQCDTCRATSHPTALCPMEDYRA